MSLVLDVPVAQLTTTLAPLRGPRTDAGTALAPLPLRVAPVGDGTYEVLDGFKRLARWRGEGCTHVPVVVRRERPRPGHRQGPIAGGQLPPAHRESDGRGARGPLPRG